MLFPSFSDNPLTIDIPISPYLPMIAAKSAPMIVFLFQTIHEKSLQVAQWYPSSCYQMRRIRVLGFWEVIG